MRKISRSSKKDQADQQQQQQQQQTEQPQQQHEQLPLLQQDQLLQKQQQAQQQHEQQPQQRQQQIPACPPRLVLEAGSAAAAAPPPPPVFGGRGHSSTSHAHCPPWSSCSCSINTTYRSTDEEQEKTEDHYLSSSAGTRHPLLSCRWWNTADGWCRGGADYAHRAHSRRDGGRQLPATPATTTNDLPQPQPCESAVHGVLHKSPPH